MRTQRAVGGVAILVLAASTAASAATPWLGNSYNVSAAINTSGSVLQWGTAAFGIPTAPAVLANSQGADSISQGGAFILVARGGSVWAAGLNDSGQLGDGSTAFHPELVQVAGLTGVKAVVAGPRTSYAIHTDGTVSAWGANAYGQLGDGSTVDRSRPAKIPSLTNVVAVAGSGWGHALALRSDGTVWAWGQNGTGNLGDGTVTSRSTPVQVKGLTGVVAIATGDGHSLALRGDGTLWGWGWNAYGQLALSEESLHVATQITAVGTVVAMSGGGNRSYALKADGSVWAFGANTAGDLGINDAVHTEVSVPTRLPGLPFITQIAAGYDHGLALARDGNVFAWGRNDYGQLGDGTILQRSSPVQVLGPGARGFLNLLADPPPGIDIAPFAVMTASPLSGTAPLHVTLDAGATTDPDGTIANYQWIASSGETATGRTTSMVLSTAGTIRIKLVVTDNAGASSLDEKTVVVLAPAGSTAPMVSGSSTHSLALKTDGTVWAWGVAAYLAKPQTRVREPAPVFTNLSGIRSIAAGWWNHSYAIGADGSVWGWGFDSSGELGNGALTPFANVPVKALISDVVAAAAGDKYGVFLKADGTVWATGYNADGRLGDGSLTDRASPVQVRGLSHIVAIAVGRWHALALTDSGRVWAWGLNGSGQIGDGSTTNRTSAVQLNIQNVKRIAAGSTHSVAVTTDGSVWAWGSNWTGQLGDGTRNDHWNPAVVPGAIGIVEIGAGDGHTMALSRDGTVLAWGGNCFPTSDGCEGTGQIGDGTLVTRLRPTAVRGLTRVAGISAGFASSMAYRFDGTVWMWGRNTDGQLGDGTFAHRLSPQLVLGADGQGFLDLLPDIANEIPADKLPSFFVLASDSSTESVRNVAAEVQYRASDIGKSASTFVFAWAPSKSVSGLPSAISKDGAAPCVLAQLDSSGHLVAASASNLQAFTTGVLTSQGQAVTILNGVPTVNISGATFFVGYGQNSASMVDSGTNRSVSSTPGLANCQPQAPKTGWWWNPQEGGRGYSIEVQGNHLFFAAFHYDVSGRATWNVASGPTSLDGAIFNADLLNVHGGQTLSGPYNGFPQTSVLGPISLFFSDASHGTMIWPGGTVPIERQPFIPGSLDAVPLANQPESGWWWNPQESGRGFFMEWQGGKADIAGYMYDDSGNPVWYIAVYDTPTPLAFSGSWWSYANGQSMGGAYRAPTQTSNNVASVTITFSGPDAAIMTLPGGRTTALVRQRF